MSTIVAITPIGRNQNQIEYSDGRKTIRCSTKQNFWNYQDENGDFHPLDPADENEVYSSKNNRIEYHRKKNVFSVGMRGDGNAEKFIGIRPDFDQVNGNEQFEITISEIKFDGIIQPILLNQKNAIDNFTTDFGGIIVQSARAGLRTMVKAAYQIDSFRIEYMLHAKGLTIEKKGDEFWVYSTAPDKPFRMRIGKPRLLNMNMEILTDYEPVVPMPLDFINHTLINNNNGTYTYIKESNADFDRSKLPSNFLIDADIYYSSTSDGSVHAQNADFTTCRNGTTGYAVRNADAQYNMALSLAYSTGNWYVIRAFFYFNTSGVNMSGKRATLNISGYIFGQTRIIAQKGLQSDPFVIGDFDSFEGAPNGPIIADFGDSWLVGANNSAIINNNNYIVNGITKVICRERNYDFDNSQPGSNTFNGCYFTESASNDPYIEVDDKPYVPHIMLIH